MTYHFYDIFISVFLSVIPEPPNQIAFLSFLLTELTPLSTRKFAKYFPLGKPVLQLLLQVIKLVGSILDLKI